MKRSIFFICLFFLLVNISTAAQTKENKFKMYFDKVGETSFYFYDLATKVEVDELSFELYEKDKFQYKANFGVHAEVYENGSLSADLVFSSFNVIDDQDGNMLTSDTPAAGSGTGRGLRTGSRSLRPDMGHSRGTGGICPQKRHSVMRRPGNPQSFPLSDLRGHTE